MTTTLEAILLTDGQQAHLYLAALLAGMGVTTWPARSCDDVLGRALGGGDVVVLVAVDDPASRLSSLRHLRSRPGPPLVVLVAPETTEEEVESLYDVGATQVLTRPIVAAVLRPLLHRLAVFSRAPSRDLSLDERLGLLVENIKDYAIVLYDVAGIILQWHGGAERITGFSATDAIGQPTDLIFTPEDRAAGQPRHELAKAASTGRAEDLRWHQKKDGGRFFADGVMIALHDDSGQLRGFGKVFKDVTEGKRSEERLRLLDRLGQATRAASDPNEVMATLTRLLGEHLGASRCAYADLEPDNDRFTIRHDWTAPGVTTSAGVYSLDRFGPRAATELRAGRSLVVNDVVRELAPEQGADMFTSIGIESIVSCPLVKDGRLVALMAVHQATARFWKAEDVGLIEEVVDRAWAHIERIRAAEVLREQDRRKDEFLATLAHELRNPLAPLRTGLDVLRPLPPGDPTVTRTHGIMERQLEHMVHLIDDLLDVSRISRGKVELRKERVAVQAVVEHALEVSRPLIQAAAHDVHLHLPDEPLWLDGDLTRLAQVVSNLLNNAAKYTPRQGRIEVSARATSGQAIVQVTDTGSGIASDMLLHVFDLFSQVDRTLHHAQGGLGIGLSLARKLVELHGGTLEAASPGLGQGSTFTVRLPLAGAMAHVRKSSPVPAPAPPLPRRILVVDDNEDAAELLTLMLARQGHSTRAVYSGHQALSLVDDFRPEVIFLDLGMPEMSGYEVAWSLRANPALAGLTLVALTGWGSDADRQQTQRAGFDAHLTKPVNASAIDEVLARFPRPEQ